MYVPGFDINDMRTIPRMAEGLGLLMMVSTKEVMSLLLASKMSMNMPVAPSCATPLLRRTLPAPGSPDTVLLSKM
jgi:hypothetical protein